MSEVCILQWKYPFLQKYIKSYKSLKICPNETITLSCSPIRSNNPQNTSPVFLSSSGISPICFVNKSNTAIFWQTVIIIWKKCSKQKAEYVPPCFCLPIIFLVFNPSESRFSDGIYVLQTTLQLSWCFILYRSLVWNNWKMSVLETFEHTKQH